MALLSSVLGFVICTMRLRAAYGRSALSELRHSTVLRHTHGPEGRERLRQAFGQGLWDKGRPACPTREDVLLPFVDVLKGAVITTAQCGQCHSFPLSRRNGDGKRMSGLPTASRYS